MLIGRDRELAALDRVLSGARVAQSGALALVGEAGIGKSTLLDEAVRSAGDGLLVLRATGSPLERDLAFAVLHQLLGPVLDHRMALPGPQVEALEVALALRGGGERVDRFAVGAATLSLLSRVAKEKPVLAVVDDAHEVDRSSAEALAFAVRRLVADPVAVLAAGRPTEGSPLLTSLPRLELGGLDTHAVARLLTERAGRRAGDEVAERVRASTGGNPLAVVELAAELETVERTPPTRPPDIPARVLAAYGRRAAGLAPEARTALLVAALGDGDVARTAAAAAALDVDLAVLADAEAVGLVRIDGAALTFPHPLARASAYAVAPPQQRRDAHRALAAVLPDADRRAWHLAEATIGPDAVAADALADAARRADERGAHAVAVAGYERAADLTPEPAVRSRRLAAAGESAWEAGDASRATDLLERAEHTAADPVAAARAAARRGAVEMRGGSLTAASDLLAEALRRLDPDDPDAAALAACDLVGASFFLADTTGVRDATRRLRSLVPRLSDPTARTRARLAAGIGLITTGEDGIALVRQSVGEMVDRGSADDPLRPGWGVLGPLFLRESSTGRDLVDHAVERIRARNALGSLPYVLFLVSRDAAASDRWGDARSGYEEGIALARETGQTNDLAMLLAGLAWLESRVGSADACEEHAVEATELHARNHVHLARAWAAWARGDLALGQGDTTAALDHYRGLVAMLDEIGLLDVDLRPTPEIVECLLRAGRSEEAAACARDYADRAEAKGQPWARARAARTAALLLGPGDAAEAALAQALALQRETPDTFEEARTLLATGSMRRRDRRRAEARAPLRDAVAVFDRLGARPWADAAAAELAATGEHPRRRNDRSIDALTPQELQIARMLGSGRTTKQAAAALFLSPKTVEYHLRHVYTKLGINDRDALARALEQ
ncbi:putative ATPase [Mumia flava]|uniref:Putative ATPase n=1 Tax=Mumia flava TaxID=1348852 RepID=A0A0B2BBR3_9ACTN|nr:helix-turn-helix transcriptional regulator [Mumia flava]PJJ53903.1 putative ATPase [Mumia flava]